MVKLVFRSRSPGVDAASPAGQPRTLYRVGRGYGRLEHPPDPEKGTRMLVIVNEPHTWVIDLERGVGQYGRDPGPTYFFHAPVLPPPAGPDSLRSLEFGREFEFLGAHGAQPTRTVEADGSEAERYEVSFEPFKLVVLAIPGSEVPRALRIFDGAELVAAWDYDSYERDLDPDPALFRPPEGVRIFKRSK